MFFELIATFVAGIAAAGLVMLINRTVGGRLPRWFAPVAAGAAMFVATIANEYGWYSRTSDALPEGVTVVQTVENKSFYRPWTYVWPFVERFVSVDTATIRTHPAQSGVKMADIYLFGRWSAVNKLPVLVNCPENKRAALADGISFEDNGTVNGADWVEVPESDPIVFSVCGEK
ncbi:MAG: hypothetical protein ABJJ37_25050 [Roseibium sp.]